MAGAFLAGYFCAKRRALEHDAGRFKKSLGSALIGVGTGGSGGRRLGTPADLLLSSLQVGAQLFRQPFIAAATVLVGSLAIVRFFSFHLLCASPCNMVPSPDCQYPARDQRCRSSGVEHSLGKGEVESSNLSGSTMFSRAWLFAAIQSHKRGTRSTGPLVNLATVTVFPVTRPVPSVAADEGVSKVLISFDQSGVHGIRQMALEMP